MDRRTTTGAPFRERWLEPGEDLRQRFGRLQPSLSLREVAVLTGLCLLAIGVVVVALELYVG